jgi:cytochrome c553
VFASIALGLFGVSIPATIQAQRSGVQAWVQTCGNCHAIQPANRYDAVNWQRIVSHMRVAARISDAEAQAITQFLQSGARQIASTEQPQEVAVLVASNARILPEYVHDSLEDWVNNCQACHGAQGAGDGPAAIAFNPKPANFTDAGFQASRSDDELIASITEGKGGMPSFSSQLTAAQIGALVRYIRTLGPRS